MSKAASAGVRILPLTEQDVERLCRLAAEIWREHYPGIISPAQIEYMLAQRYDPRMMRAELRRGGVWWDQLLFDDRMIGFACCVPGENVEEMKLDKLYLHRDYRRRGYGGMLLERAAAIARAAGCARLVLAVNRNNHGAVHAYEKCGFSIIDTVVRDIGGGFVMDDYIMSKGV